MKNSLIVKLSSLVLCSVIIAVIIYSFMHNPSNVYLRIAIIALVLITILAPFFLLTFLKRIASGCISLGALGRFIPNLKIESGILDSDALNLKVDGLTLMSQNISTGLFILAGLCLVLDFLMEFGLIKIFGLKKIDERVQHIKDIVRESVFNSHQGNIMGFEGLQRFSEYLSVLAEGLTLHQSSFNDGINCISGNYLNLKEIFGEIGDALDDTNYKELVVRKIKTIRQGLVIEVMKRSKPYLDRYLEDFKDKDGNVLVLTGGRDADLLDLSCYIVGVPAVVAYIDFEKKSKLSADRSIE